MTVRLYFDEDSVRHAVVEALRHRGVDVVIPADVGMVEKTDEEQLDFAGRAGRTLYTFNIGDFCRLHTAWVRAGRDHAGIIVALQQHYSVGDQMRRLLRLIANRSATEMRNRLEYLSDWG